MKIQKTLALIFFLLSNITIAAFATSDGDGNYYIPNNVGIKEKNPQAELHVRGNILIEDGTEGENKILRTDANGQGIWTDISYYPDIDGTNDSFNNLVIDNGWFQDLTLNGITTVRHTISAPNINEDYILAIDVNGLTYWTINYGFNGESSDVNWQETNNTLFPKKNNGSNSIVIGSNNPTLANTVLDANGGAIFNQNQAATEDFNVGSDQRFYAIKAEVDHDQIGIWLGSPDTRLDVLGMFGLRADGTDYSTTPDNFTAVNWLAQNSTFGNNGDILTRINRNGTDKVFKLVDFLGTTNGVKTQNGITLLDLAPNHLVASDANKKLISESRLTIASNGNVGIGVLNSNSKLNIGGGVLDFVDGIDDVSVAGDIEADGNIYATEFIGDPMGLFFNGVTIRNAHIYYSTIYETLTFNGGSQILAPTSSLYFDANLEFKGDIAFPYYSIFQLYGEPSSNPQIAFYSNGGQLGINTTNPLTDLDINGQIAIRDGSQANGLILTSDANGLGSWQFHDTQNVSHATNVDNATTANFTDAIVNGLIQDSDFIDGVINGSRLVNVDLTQADGFSEWLEGADGLYPKDGPTETVLVGANTITTAPIVLDSNGTFRAVKFVGDFSEVTNVYYNLEWNDQGSIMYPFDNFGAKTVALGANNLINSDTILDLNGALVINNQAQNSSFRVESLSSNNIFSTNAANGSIAINTVPTRANLTINGSHSFSSNRFSVAAASGISSAALNHRFIYLDSTGACAVDLSANPQIAAGIDGQIITLIGLYSDEKILLEDGNGLALNNNISFNLGAKDSITLMYVSALGEWIELNRTNYLERPGDSLDRGICI